MNNRLSMNKIIEAHERVAFQAGFYAAYEGDPDRAVKERDAYAVWRSLKQPAPVVPK